MVRLYMDEHVDQRITSGLRLRGADVLTVQEDNRAGISDRQVLNRAAELSRVLFTQDKDFFQEAQTRQANEVSFAGVIYAPQSRVSIGQCIADLHTAAVAGTSADFANQVRFLPF